jgi:hypothetical protein
LRDQVRLRSFKGGGDAPRTHEEAGELPVWNDGFYAGLDAPCLKGDGFY